MKILVTGANGQLGKKIFDLSKKLDGLSFYFCDIDTLDITNQDSVENYLKAEEFDVLINCAAYTAVDLAESDEQTAREVNALAPSILAEACNHQGIKFIHISTDYVFDGYSNLPYNEESKVNPLSVYGKTKLEGELNSIEKNPNSIIIRTSWLYSEYGKNFFKTISKLAKENETIRVVFDQIGTPTYAGDLAAAILEIVKMYSKNAIWYAGLYHFSNLGLCSWYDFAVEIINCQKLKTSVLPVLSSEFPTKAHRPAYSVLDKSKIVKTFGLAIPHWRTSLLTCNTKI